MVLFLSALLIFASGCVPGAGNMQGSALPFVKDEWRGRYSAEYAVTERKNPSESKRLIISYAPSGRDKVLVTMVLKEMNDVKSDSKERAEIEAYLDKASLQPVEVNKTVSGGRAHLEVKTHYQGPRVSVQIIKSKKRKQLQFDSPSKVYYDNDVFLLILQALDFNAYFKVQSKSKHGTTSVALAHPQLGHVPVIAMQIKKKKESILISAKEMECYRVELSYGKLMTHRAWYEAKQPHRLVRYETEKEMFTLKNF